MIRLLIFAGVIVAFMWLFLGYMAAKAELRWQKKTLNPKDGYSRVIVLVFFFLGLIGYIVSWLSNEDEMRAIHNLPPRSYTSKPYRKTWTERFFGE